MNNQNLIDSLQEQANQLAENMEELNRRIELLTSKGQDASSTTEESLKASKEIGRINDAIRDLLGGYRDTGK